MCEDGAEALSSTGQTGDRWPATPHQGPFGEGVADVKSGEESQSGPVIAGGDAAILPPPADSSAPDARSLEVNQLIAAAVQRIVAGLAPVTVPAIASAKTLTEPSKSDPPAPTTPPEPPRISETFSVLGVRPDSEKLLITPAAAPPPVPPEELILSDDPLRYGPVEEERSLLNEDGDRPSEVSDASLALESVFRRDPEPLFGGTETNDEATPETVLPPPLPAAQAISAIPETIAPPAQKGGLAGHLAGPWTLRRVLRLAGLAIAAYFATVLFLILAYRVINPPTTTLIAYQWLTGTTIEQDWQPIENISPNLLRAVVVSEDWGFCTHYGVDIDALEKALELAGEGKVARGASTISMQVIKNLFLSQSKSYLRKAIEIPLTVVAETVWPKSRMLEIYLNIAEWGPGIFGAEAAARHHFSKPASRLTEREAALLAAALPNPILRDAGDPGTRTARKASVIQARMRAAGPVANCAMTARQRSANERSNREPNPPSDWQTTVKKRAGTDPAL